MIALHGRARSVAGADRLDQRVWRVAEPGEEDSPRRARLVGSSREQDIGAPRTLALVTGGGEAGTMRIELPDELGYLSPGDVVSVSPDGQRVRVLYRRGGRQNSVLLTERCDNYCLMCSQPPKARLDDHLLEDARELIPLIDDPAQGLCFTGGEPTLYGDRFIELLRGCREHLPESQIHVLSNGRRFADATFATAYGAVGHPGVMVGIPLYGAEAQTHDYVVQARGAFSETVTGILRLGELQQRIELRVVVHRQTVPVLVEIARFIARNLPFVEQVALMGLEMMGFARANIDLLWADPAEYRDELREAALILHHAGVRTLLYNHQLCVIDRDLWPFAVRSISDWKNDFHDECGACEVRGECCGFFATATLRRSAHIAPVRLHRPDNPGDGADPSTAARLRMTAPGMA